MMMKTWTRLIDLSIRPGFMNTSSAARM